MLQWFLFGGAPLLAATWMVIAAVRAPAGVTLRTIGIAAAQAVVVIAVAFGLIGSLRIAWLLGSAP
jgi:hypothetical protein